MEKLVSPENLREQARRFQVAAQKLREVADVLEGVSAPRSSIPNLPGILPAPRRGRINEMIGLLKEHPMTAKDIVDKMKVSRGAVYAWLQDKNVFENDGGVWKLKSPS